ncbi:hypothetical protein A2U01_0049404, partial [Trifolium medium]|nr:hypothetical protein [Trifolium medium]
EPLPNIGKVYSLLVQQERQSLIQLDESKILAASSQYPSGRGSSSQRGRGDKGGKSYAGRVLQEIFAPRAHEPAPSTAGSTTTPNSDFRNRDFKAYSTQLMYIIED